MSDDNEIEVCDLCMGTCRCPQCIDANDGTCDLCDGTGTCPQCAGRGYSERRVHQFTQRLPPVCDGPHDPVKYEFDQYFCAQCGVLCDAQGKGVDHG